MLRNSARKTLQEFKDIAPEVAARALWTAFPAPSENEVCETASRVLGRSPDTYRRILRKETRAAFEEIYPILALAAIRRGIDLFEWLGTPHEETDMDRAPVVRGAGADSDSTRGNVGRQGAAVESASERASPASDEQDAA